MERDTCAEKTPITSPTWSFKSRDIWSFKSRDLHLAGTVTVLELPQEKPLGCGPHSAQTVHSQLQPELPSAGAAYKTRTSDWTFNFSHGGCPQRLADASMQVLITILEKQVKYHSRSREVVVKKLVSTSTIWHLQQIAFKTMKDSMLPQGGAHHAMHLAHWCRIGFARPDERLEACHWHVSGHGLLPRIHWVTVLRGCGRETMVKAGNRAEDGHRGAYP
jgi:hypothetical protein